jgi:hypothetical protein
MDFQIARRRRSLSGKKRACQQDEKSRRAQEIEIRQIQEEILILNLKKTCREAWRPNHTLRGGFYTANFGQKKRRPHVSFCV